MYLLEECFRVLMDIITVHMGEDISHFSGRESYLSKMTEIAFSLSTERLFEIADAFRKAYEQKSNNLELVFRSVIIGIICRQSVISDLIKKVEALELEVSALRKEPPQIRHAEPANEQDKTGTLPASEANSKTEEIPKSNKEDGNSSDSLLSDDEIANDLASLGFSYIDEDPFEEPKETSAKEETSNEQSSSAEENIFGDFARFFRF